MSAVILLFSRDPGGANTLIPLISPLKKRGYRILLFGKDRALDQYKKFDFSGKKLIGRSIKSFLEKLRPDMIITGTSGSDKTEKNIWFEARKLNIPTFAILDQWMNIDKRFSSRYYPDTIFVMDGTAKNDLVKNGSIKSQIIVSGQPYFEYILKNKSKLSVPKQISKNDFVVTFVSEPLSTVYGNNLGYTEYSILEEILKAVGLIAQLCSRRVKFVIKLHPNDEKKKYTSYLHAYKFKNLEIIIDDVSNSWDSIRRSELVCGMSSMVLLESVLLGVPILSVQIGLKTKNPFILERLGITKSIRDQITLTKSLKSAILDSKLPESHFHPKINAIQTIISTIEK